MDSHIGSYNDGCVSYEKEDMLTQSAGHFTQNSLYHLILSMDISGETSRKRPNFCAIIIQLPFH